MTFFLFLRSQKRGGGPPIWLLSKNITNPEIMPILGYFCLLWAGPAEQCCTPVYLPIEDFGQKLPFCWDSLAPKYGRGGSSHPCFLLNHQKSWNSAYFGVLLSVVGWWYRTVLPPTRLFSKNTLFLAKKLAIFGHFWTKPFFFTADGPATPNRLLQYNSKHISLGRAP